MGTNLPPSAGTHAHSGEHTSEHALSGHASERRNAEEETRTPREFWEQRYAGSGGGAVWSGMVNRSLAEVVADLAPGRSLDLGCGEGGDVLWLAERGWHALGLELSETAVARARGAAAERGLQRARFVQADLGEWAAIPVGAGSTASAKLDGAGAGAGAGDSAAVIEEAGSFDLITASFLQSPVELPRERILRAAAARVGVGGRLVVIAHAAPPRQMPQHPGDFPSPEEELALLALDDAAWHVEVAEVRVRQGNMPDGTQADFQDTVVVARRFA